MNYIDPKELEDNCYKKAKETVVIRLTTETRQELEHRYADLSAKLKEKTDFKDSVTDLMNVDADNEDMLKQSLYDLIETSNFAEDGIKKLKQDTYDILNNLKKGFISEERIVFWMEDRLSDTMQIYLENGDFYESRPFTEEDRKTTLKMLS